MTRRRRANPVNEAARLDYASYRADGVGPDDLRVVVVDGEKVRRHIDTDFTMGGNPSRYAYVPHGELWVEKNLTVADTVSTIIHESIEHRLMKHRGLSYAQAHEIANKVDDHLRDAIDDAMSIVDEY